MVGRVANVLTVPEEDVKEVVKGATLIEVMPSNSICLYKIETNRFFNISIYALRRVPLRSLRLLRPLRRPPTNDWQPAPFLLRVKNLLFKLLALYTLLNSSLKRA